MIRSGWVANSSSASFIVYDSCANVAHAMVDIVAADWQEVYAVGKRKVAEIRRLRKAMFTRIRHNINKFRLDLSHDVHGITLPSTNEDTYVLAMDDSDEACWVQTCNNHNWDDLEYSYLGEDENRLLRLLTSRSWFFDTRTGTIVSREHCCDTYKCPECEERCFTYRLQRDGGAHCPYCGESVNRQVMKEYSL